MALSAYAEQMIKTASATEHGSDHLFMSFIQAALGQLRSHYTASVEPEQAVTHLAEAWHLLCNATVGEPNVAIDGTDSKAVLSTWMKDQPFIVDTIQLGLTQAGCCQVRGFNLVLSVGRDDDGKVVRIQEPSDQLESLTRYESTRPEGSEFVLIAEGIRGNLNQAQQVVQDFKAITKCINQAVKRLTKSDDDDGRGEEKIEAAAFLQWLLADNFVFMGVLSGNKRLGIEHPNVASLWTPEGHDGATTLDTNSIVEVRKSHIESVVHRSGQMDEIHLRIPQRGGEGSKTLTIRGLFTYRGVTQANRHIPLLRRTLTQILAREQCNPGSFRFKAISNVFDSLPTEYLFDAGIERIEQMIARVLEAEHESDVRVYISQSNTEDMTFVLTALPQDRWNEELRSQVERLIVAATGASYWDQGIFFGRYNTMLAHFYLTGTHSLQEDAIQTLSGAISHAATSWSDRLLEALGQQHSEAETAQIFSEYGSAFEEMYQRKTSAKHAVNDLLHLAALNDGARFQASLYTDETGRLTLRLYQSKNLLLSEILPILDHFGLVITDQYHDPVKPKNGAEQSIDTFRLQGVQRLTNEEVSQRADLLVNALEAVFQGHMPDDVFNRILLPGALPWQAVDMIRAYFGYARQLGLPYTATRVQALMLARPGLLQTIWQYFQARFDPAFTGNRISRMQSLADEIEDTIRAIKNHDLDVVYRTLFNLLNSTLRTNFFRSDRTEHYISYKINCADVGDMPAPRMKYEIYVHHREMEGVHLRGGKIARGGIRWSDRQDYRREILDLATTQRVKNVLIVPEGAKGGFYIKVPIRDRAERRRRADELYQILIRGLLDITDNVVNGAVVQPPEVVVHDENDPYLVVAADKGTAHLSDTANGLSQSYGFWLDDAFASGGSNGYDHKKVGITARGGWMTVRRLFRENGLEPNTDTFTVAGIGDTGGDVFGNGVIEHETIKLVAAFNHLHIFFDPDPDPARSYKERKRLFDAAKGWDAYDTSTLSEGGGIFSRQSKSIQLTPQIQELLGVLKDELPVDTVLRLILRLNVDLLWNGGIGTYVKASHETHADAGDPSNDSVRVDATQLRCKAVGEGGNLGFTQAARVEFALHGGNINTDFIDNSGGVDMSDHEVNLKILLNPLVSSGSITLDERNVLLEKLTNEVADDVLNNNDNHARQLSLDVIRSERDPMWFSSTIDWACSRSKTSRIDLQLPSDDDLKRRVASRQGLTRPELATVQAHVKIHAYNALQESNPDNLPGFRNLVLDYFPTSVAKQWPDAIAAHMLYQSIGATVLTNRIVGLSGSWFFPLVSELTSASIERISNAWIHAHALVGGEEIANELSNGQIPFQGRYKAWIMVTDAILELVVGWCIPGESGPTEQHVAQVREALQRVSRISDAAKDDRIDSRIQSLESKEVPTKLAKRIAKLGEISIAREVAILHNGQESLRDTIVRYIAVGEASRILPSIRALTIRKSEGGWDPVATGILRYRYVVLLRELIGVLPKSADVRLGVDRMKARLGLRTLKELQGLMDHILGDQPSVAAFMVAEARVHAWTEHFEA